MGKIFPIRQADYLLEATEEDIFRFSRKIIFTERCWEWARAKFDSGYGAFRIAGQNVRAHRFAFQAFIRPLEIGEDALHSCDNPGCVRPADLFPGNNALNVADRDAKGRTARGEHSGSAKLSDDLVAEILSDRRSQREIAAVYGVCKSTIGYIKRGEYWRHIGREK